MEDSTTIEWVLFTPSCALMRFRSSARVPVLLVCNVNVYSY